MLGYFDQENEMRTLVDYFSKGTPDTEWMPKVASWKGNPVIVAGDGRIFKNKVEKRILAECNITFVYLASGWTNTIWDIYAWKIIKVWPDIVRNVKQANYPMLFKVTIQLKVQSIGRISTL